MSIHEEDMTFDPILFNLLDISMDVMAKHLTAEFSERLCRIEAEELTSGEWTGRRKTTLCPNVVAFTQFFNDISYWVIEEILLFDTKESRACRITYFIGLACKLADVSNLSGVLAIISALRSSPIHRLEQSMHLVSLKYIERLQVLVDIVGPDHNHSNARKIMDECVVGVPLLNVFLSDIAMIQTVADSDDKVDAVLSRFKHLQNPYGVRVPALSEYLKSKMTTVLEGLQSQTEDRLYALSLKLEPHIPVEFDSVPTNLRVPSFRSLKGSRSLDVLPAVIVTKEQESTSSSYSQIFNRGVYNILPVNGPIICHEKSYWNLHIRSSSYDIDSQETSSPSIGLMRSLIDDSVIDDETDKGNDGDHCVVGNNKTTRDFRRCFDKIKHYSRDDRPPCLEAFLQHEYSVLSEDNTKLLSGVLRKQDGHISDKHRSKWRRYKVELYQHCLTFYGIDPTYMIPRKRFKKFAQGSLPLSWILRIERDSTVTCFPKRYVTFSLELRDFIFFRFRASSKDSGLAWVEAIEKLLARNDEEAAESLIHFENFI